MSDFLALLVEGMLIAGSVLLAFVFLVSSPSTLRNNILEVVKFARIAISGALAGIALVSLIGIPSLIGAGVGAGTGILVKASRTLRVSLQKQQQ
jgi:hypothetical protein